MYEDNYGWPVQSRFSHHEPCPACGSKDNLARYESGSGYCFGCGYFEKPKHPDNPHRALSEVDGGPTSPKDNLRSPPDDTDLGGYPEVVVQWIAQYGLGIPDLIRNNVGWSQRNEQLIFQFYGEGADVVLWQARNFREGTDHKHRFKTSGSPTDVIAAYYPRERTGKESAIIGTTAVLVEDCISAICISNAGRVGVPCFSAAMPEKKLTRLAGIFDRIFVWLDNDKLKESQKIARQLGLLGVQSRVIHTKYDPKIYALDVIEAFLSV